MEVTLGHFELLSNGLHDQIIQHFWRELMTYLLMLVSRSCISIQVYRSVPLVTDRHQLPPRDEDINVSKLSLSDNIILDMSKLMPHN